MKDFSRYSKVEKRDVVKQIVKESRDIAGLPKSITNDPASSRFPKQRLVILLLVITALAGVASLFR